MKFNFSKEWCKKMAELEGDFDITAGNPDVLLERMSQESAKVKWDIRFLQLAELVASWSKDPSTKVGAVIVDDQNRVVSLGFNGFPRGISDSEELLSVREKKYERILHAEQNAILFGASRDIRGGTLYTHPLSPCNRCALEIIQSGIKRVVSLNDVSERWKDSIEISLDLFREAGITVDLY